MHISHIIYQDDEAALVHKRANHALPQSVVVRVELPRAQVLGPVAPLVAVQQRNHGRDPGRALQAIGLPLVPGQQLLHRGRGPNAHHDPARVGQTVVEAPVELVEHGVLIGWVGVVFVRVLVFKKGKEAGRERVRKKG